ncbi:DUF1566 domain-containing protein [Motilimonas sp. KMU-193]|uniref:Lcl C-terminal domain-containing protein n=1 Tax=Motilimonas sp. KMU-193 TaxID=3388668 RepID=UPI00396AF9EA
MNRPLKIAAAIGISASMLMHCAAAQELPLRYQKVHQQGHSIAPKSGPWHCVRDNETGLLWEVKSVQEGAHYYKSTYSWFWQQQGTPRGGSCALADGYAPCDTEQLINLFNHIQYCGVSDWRLPNLSELQSLLDYSAYHGRALVPAGLFPNTVRGPYWTSQWDQALDQPITVHFGTGEINHLSAQGVAWLRLVSGPVLAAKPANNPINKTAKN